MKKGNACLLAGVLLFGLMLAACGSEDGNGGFNLKDGDKGRIDNVDKLSVTLPTSLKAGEAGAGLKMKRVSLSQAIRLSRKQAVVERERALRRASLRPGVNVDTGSLPSTKSDAYQTFINTLTARDSELVYIKYMVEAFTNLAPEAGTLTVLKYDEDPEMGSMDLGSIYWGFDDANTLKLYWSWNYENTFSMKVYLELPANGDAKLYQDFTFGEGQYSTSYLNALIYANGYFTQTSKYAFDDGLGGTAYIADVIALKETAGTFDIYGENYWGEGMDGWKQYGYADNAGGGLLMASAGEFPWLSAEFFDGSGDMIFREYGGTTMAVSWLPEDLDAAVNLHDLSFTTPPASIWLRVNESTWEDYDYSTNGTTGWTATGKTHVWDVVFKAGSAWAAGDVLYMPAWDGYTNQGGFQIYRYDKYYTIPTSSSYFGKNFYTWNEWPLRYLTPVNSNHRINSNLVEYMPEMFETVWWMDMDSSETFQSNLEPKLPIEQSWKYDLVVSMTNDPDMGMEYEVYDWKEAHYYYVYGENSVLATAGLQYNNDAQAQVNRIKSPLQSGWNRFTVDGTRFKNLQLPAFPPGM